MISEEAGSHDGNVSSETSKPISAKGLSELSKQLRILQSTNNEKNATIDKLERKLKILTDLKGISLHDLKSALMDACRGEAFNELQTEVRILRSKLEIAKSKNSAEINFDQREANQNMVNLELRVGELEEVEESLQTELSKLYELLREETSKTTNLETSCKQYQNQKKDLEEKYKDMNERRDRDHKITIQEFKYKLETADNKASSCERQIVHQKEQIEDLKKRISEYEEMECWLSQSRKDVKDLKEMLLRQESENKELYEADQEITKKKMEKMQTEMDNVNSKLVNANKRVQSLEGQVAKMFSLELTIAKQKVHLRQMAEESEKSNKEKDKVHKTALDTAKTDIEKLQIRAKEMESKSKSDYNQIAFLQNQLESLKDIEKRNCELADEVEYERKNFDVYKTKHESEIVKIRTKAERDLQAHEKDMSVMRSMLLKETDKVKELENQILRSRELEDTCEKQKNIIDTLLTEKENMKRQMISMEKQRGATAASIAEMKLNVDDADMKRRVEEAKSESLKKQIKAISKEAELRKNQFRSRFALQDERIRDLLQQVSSLQTAFNLERGERTEEHRHQAELQSNLNEADSEVAHQLYIGEEEKYQEKNGRNDSTIIPPRYESERVGGEDKIAEGYLVRKEGNRWRKRFFILHGSFTTGHFKMSYSDGPQKAIKGVIDGIQTSVSRVFPTKKFPKQPILYPNTFVVQLNPFDPQAIVLTLASQNAEDLEKWMNALEMVTIRLQTKGTPSMHQTPKSFKIGSKVIIVDLIKHPEYNGLTGVITRPLEDNKQCITLDELHQEVKLPTNNLELFAMPDVQTSTTVRYRV